MRKPKDHRSTSTKPLALLLLTLMLLSIHTPAAATPITYTYTGPTFNNFSGTFPAPPSPSIGNALSIEFTYDGALPLDVDFSAAAQSFTMTCGELVLSAANPLFISTLFIHSVDAGLPTSWICELSEGSSPGDWMLFSVHGVASDFVDQVVYGSTVFSNVDTDSFVGGWVAAPAPLPPTVLLLGSGLLGLVGWRRFRKG